MKTRGTVVPQIRLRSALNAGESVQACMNNLNYWTKQLEKKCSYPGNAHVPGITPYYESEMKPWQAGGV